MGVYPTENKLALDTSFKQEKEYLNFEMITSDLQFQNRNTAEIEGTQTLTFRSEGGEIRQEKKPFTARLQRKGAEWVIVSISHAP
jgi:hypothetical protein